jgi:hypothetical protein
MNCLEFHRAKLADPRRLAPEARAHGAECAACNAFAKSVDEAERDLERSAAVPVPEGLADRVLLRVRGDRPAWKMWALAASVLVAVALGASLFLYEAPAAQRYARQAIEHVAMEPESLTMVKAPDAGALAELIRVSGGTLKAPLGTVRYVQLCPVENGTGLHLVFETAEGLATLLIVPRQPLQKLQHASATGWAALARPAGRGHYAVVTPSADKTAAIDRLVRERIDWGA